MRAGRFRAKHRPIAPADYRLTPYDVERFSFGTDQTLRNDFHAMFLGTIFRELEDLDPSQWPCILGLLDDLECIATLYRSWKPLLHPSRSEAAFQLKLLSELAARGVNVSAEEQGERIRLVLNANDAAQPALWAALMKLGIEAPVSLTENELSDPDTNWTIFSEAAIAATAYCAGGDYSNSALAYTIESLVDRYKIYQKTVSDGIKSYKTPNRFILCFFKYVDHEMDTSSITNMIDRSVKARRA